MFFKVFQLFVNPLLCEHVTECSGFLREGEDGESSVMKILTVFFTFINLHIGPSYQAVAAMLAQPAEERLLRWDRGRKQVGQRLDFLNSSRELGTPTGRSWTWCPVGGVGAQFWMLLPILDFSSEELAALPPHDSCQGKRVHPPLLQYNWLCPSLQHPR